MIGMSCTCASSDSLETPPAPFFVEFDDLPQTLQLSLQPRSYKRQVVFVCRLHERFKFTPVSMVFKLNLKKCTTQKRITEPSSHAKEDPNRFITLNKDLHSQNTTAKSHVLRSHQSSTDSLATNQPAFFGLQDPDSCTLSNDARPITQEFEAGQKCTNFQSCFDGCPPGCKE